MPDGVLNVVTGFGHEAGQALSRHNDLTPLPLPVRPVPETAAEDVGESNMTRLAGSGRAKAPESLPPIVRIWKRQRHPCW
ncbi:hypothetical protein ACLBR5_18995 [Escherichia coli]